MAEEIIAKKMHLEQADASSELRKARGFFTFSKRHNLFKSRRTRRPLALHACCGPCSLEPVRLLREEGFEPTIFWSNPNIQPQEEYDRRLETLVRWAKENDIKLVNCDAGDTNGGNDRGNEEGIGSINSGAYNDSTDGVNSGSNARGHDSCKKSATRQQYLRGIWEEKVAPKAKKALLKTDKTLRENRCRECYALRLEESACEADARGFKFFSTTLAVSPYQHFEVCAQEVTKAAAAHGMEPVWRDFRSHYPEATRRSRSLGMYRQKYCGCRFSASEAALEKKARKAEKARRERSQGQEGLRAERNTSFSS